MPKELSDIPTTFDGKTENTGASKTIEGTPAHEVLLTENMSFHDPKGGNDTVTYYYKDTVTYYYKNDVWLANSEPPGWKEIEDFNRRLAAEMAFNAATNPFTLITAARPGLADGLKKLGEEQKKQCLPRNCRASRDALIPVAASIAERASSRLMRSSSCAAADRSAMCACAAAQTP